MSRHIPTRIIGFLKGDEFLADKTEVARQNRLAVRYFAVAGIPVAIANIAAQAIIEGAPQLSLQSYWLILYYAVLFLLDRFVIPMNYRHSTRLVYVCEAPVLLVSIFLGTIWDPTHQAITFLMFIVTLPVFILDRPGRLMGVMLGWSLLFLALCYAVKDPSLHQSDTIHVVEFYFSSVAIVFVVLKLRLEVMQSLERTRYHLEHDVITDTQNQRGLAAHSSSYIGKQLFVTMGDIDHFSLLNDFYGHEIGDGLLLSFANTLKKMFGVLHTYRYGGDEMLCIVTEGDNILSKGLERVAECQKAMGKLRTESMYSNITCSFGYVVGTPETDRDLYQMIQLANIYAHQAKRQGEGKVIGGQFDEQALHDGIVESSIATHARAYEINQLTGMPSMAYFIERSSELLQHVADLERKPVVGFFNLVHFHDFNDKFGYAQGDELIRYTADMLREVLPKRHVTYISGSQFGVLCYLDEVEPTMDGLTERLRAYKTDHEVQVKAGFVEYNEGDTVISLLDKARLAHDSIVELRDVSYRMYDPRLDEEVRFRQHLITHLDDAIANDWIKVYYQPIVHASSGEICNLEALSRWDDPTYGFLPPGKFISVLESERLIYKLTLCVVRRVLQDFRQLEKKGVPLVPVSVNLSRNDFFECDIVHEICSLVDESGYPRRMLSIEITESAFAEDQGRLKTEIDRLRSLGFPVWMDDFGSEYSTLNILEDLNFDLIKVDMQFMRNFTGTGRNAIILGDIIGMCRRLGVTTLVEGVETQEQYDLLRQLGTDKLQGYLFSRPSTLKELFG